MLARVANSLYWAGRYIERSDHTSRFLNVNYFSSLDAPNIISKSRNFVLESLLFLAGHEYEDELIEEKVIYHIGLDQNNPNSVISNVINGRQNAHKTRHLLSTEVWESINKLYHFINNYSQDVFLKTGLFDLTSKVSEMCSIIREKVVRTLLHDEVWCMLMLGIHIERALQIVRLMRTKFTDIEKIKIQNPGIKDLSYELATLLRCAESFDMSKKHYKGMPNGPKTIEFLVLNKKNPKSLIKNIEKINDYVIRIGQKQTFNYNNVEFKIGKLAANFKFLTMEDLNGDFFKFLDEYAERLVQISNAFEEEYLNF